MQMNYKPSQESKTVSDMQPKTLASAMGGGAVNLNDASEGALKEIGDMTPQFH